MHFKYARYVLRHKWYVFIEACRLGVWWRGLTHDLSKLHPAEWVPYTRYFYGSYPSVKETFGDMRNSLGRTKEEVDTAFDAAWLRHQHRNDHHWQHWVLREDDGGTKVLRMSESARAEMLADWRGAGRAITGKDNTRDWYLANKDRMILHHDTRAWVEAKLGLRASEHDISAEVAAVAA